ncbi:MAG: DUF481 domain-containing protein [Gemmatimonadota bacterium]
MPPRPAFHLATLAALTILLPTPGIGQVILNTERFQIDEVDGIHVGVDASLSGQRGNTELFDVSSSGIVGILTSRHWIRTIFGGRYLAQEGKEAILDRQFVQLRYSYLLSPKLRTFHFVQVQSNETLLLRNRWLVGTGVRYSLVETERTRFALGTGMMGEWERLDPAKVGADDPTSLDAWRLANLGVLIRDFDSGARLVNILYVQPDVEDLGDVRILLDAGLSVPVTEWVRTNLSLEWRHDTRPVSTLESDDLIFGMGLGISFN